MRRILIHTTGRQRCDSGSNASSAAPLHGPDAAPTYLSGEHKTLGARGLSERANCRHAAARRFLAIAILALIALPQHVAAQDNEEAVGTGEVKETVEVKRADTKGPKHPSLRFLRDHRVFLRSQLDLLRLQITRERGSDAEMLDARYLRLKEMAAAIAAARDTVDVMHGLTPQKTILESVTDLGELEAELNLMEKLLGEQRRRLLLLEEDFLGHQETALVILLKGVAGQNAPASIVLSEQNDIFRVALTAEQQASLEQGGIAQIYHEFVEPREHVFAVSFLGDTWTGTPPVSVALEAARDRLTFLELDLTELDHDGEALGLRTTVWHR